MAGIPSFFKQYKPRGFNYTPMYYDADKERREERERLIKAELGIKDEGTNDKEYVPRITRGSMTNYFSQQKTRVQRYTLIRLIVIVLVLFLITYVFLYL